MIIDFAFQKRNVWKFELMASRHLTTDIISPHIGEENLYGGFICLENKKRSQTELFALVFC